MIEGQKAANVAREFNDQLEVTGVITYKDWRWYSWWCGAFCFRHITGKPFKFHWLPGRLLTKPSAQIVWPAVFCLSIGRYADSWLRSFQEYDEQKADEMAEKMKTPTDFNDFIDQLDQVQNMGPMEDLLKMIPGIITILPFKNM